MGRKSSIDKLEPQVRSHIERRLRENRLTLDELIEDLHEQFPSEQKPSRSAVGRYKVSFDEMSRRLREQQAMASLLVEELGENPDDKAGALMVQSITTLTTHAALGAQIDEETTRRRRAQAGPRGEGCAGCAQGQPRGAQGDRARGPRGAARRAGTTPGRNARQRRYERTA